MKNKFKINLVIDVLLFLLMMPIAGIGFLIKYVLVKGSERNQIYGSDVDLSFLGLDRHQWGDIHLRISMVFLALLVLHIVLHWSAIVAFVKQIVPSKSTRIGIVCLFLIVSLGMFLFAFFIEPRVSLKTRNQQHENHRNHSIDSTSTENHGNHSIDSTSNKHEHHQVEVYGYQTMREVSEKYNIDTSVLCKCLQIQDVDIDEKLGRLRKTHNFTMNDVRKCLESK